MNDEAQATTSDATDDPIRPLKKLADSDRDAAMAALNELFRSGSPPDPVLQGPYVGELVCVDIAPGMTQSVDLITKFWMPWKGKFFEPAENRGDNLFDEQSRLVLQFVYPFYRDFQDYSAEAFRGFRFRTSIAEGMEDQDRQVFRIDYDSGDNPPITIRRIVDEVMQVGDGIYLGKIHFREWWGSWDMIGYFALRSPK